VNWKGLSYNGHPCSGQHVGDELISLPAAAAAAAAQSVVSSLSPVVNLPPVPFRPTSLSEQLMEAATSSTPAAEAVDDT